MLIPFYILNVYEITYKIKVSFLTLLGQIIADFLVGSLLIGSMIANVGFAYLSNFLCQQYVLMGEAGDLFYASEILDFLD